MVRAPCCEKVGLKKGPWSREEDQILVAHIKRHGHSNWRALPKLAGLLRCGKSCRLRWTNYLRPDIKRGNFTVEEEDAIIQLHQLIGNRWSAIAARLPGRTDNEIKNVWHTRLKTRLKQNQTTADHHAHHYSHPGDDLLMLQEQPPSEVPNNSSTSSSDVTWTTDHHHNGRVDAAALESLPSRSSSNSDHISHSVSYVVTSDNSTNACMEINKEVICSSHDVDSLEGLIQDVGIKGNDNFRPSDQALALEDYFDNTTFSSPCLVGDNAVSFWLTLLIESSSGDFLNLPDHELKHRHNSDSCNL